MNIWQICCNWYRCSVSRGPEAWVNTALPHLNVTPKKGVSRIIEIHGALDTNICIFLYMYVFGNHFQAYLFEFVWLCRLAMATMMMINGVSIGCGPSWSMVILVLKQRCLVLATKSDAGTSVVDRLSINEQQPLVGVCVKLFHKKDHLDYCSDYSMS